MRRYLALAAVGILALCLAWAGGRMTLPETLARTNLPPQGLGMKFVGGWSFDLYLGDSTTAVPILVTVSADGTIVTSGSPLAGGATVSTAHGSWKAVGHDTMVGTVQSLGYVPDASYGWYERGPLHWTLSNDGNRLEGTLLIGNYTPDQDYVTDEPAYGLIPCTCIGERIPAEGP
jgi:hypothetical protein